MNTYPAGRRCPISGKTTKGRIMWDVRICFGIVWYEDPEDLANAAAVTGNTYNGGYYHGMACGRDTTWDMERDGVEWKAVTS